VPAEFEVPALPAELPLLPAVPVEPLEPGCPPPFDADPAEPGFEPVSFPEEQATTESKATEATHNVLFMGSDLETYRDQWNAERQRKERNGRAAWRRVRGGGSRALSRLRVRISNPKVVQLREGISSAQVSRNDE